MHLQFWHQMEVSGEPDATATSPQAIIVWALQLVWISGEEKNFMSLLGIKPQYLDCLSCSLQVGSKDSQVKTQLVLWIFILFKVTR